MLYIMRHGKTDWNKLHKIQGRTDIPLNDEGRAMTKEAREIYKDVHFDICYCSPLSRARETAEIFLQGTNVPIEQDDRLQEMSFGVCEGIDGTYEKPGSVVRTLFEHPEQYEPADGGESFEQLYARTGQFLEEKVKPQIRQGKSVLIIGHGAMNSSIISQINGIPLSDFWSLGIENCKLKKLDEEKWKRDWDN